MKTFCKYSHSVRAVFCNDILSGDIKSCRISFAYINSSKQIVSIVNFNIKVISLVCRKINTLKIRRYTLGIIIPHRRKPMLIIHLCRDKIGDDKKDKKENLFQNVIFFRITNVIQIIVRGYRYIKNPTAK